MEVFGGIGVDEKRGLQLRGSVPEGTALFQTGSRTMIHAEHRDGSTALCSCPFRGTGPGGEKGILSGEAPRNSGPLLDQKGKSRVGVEKWRKGFVSRVYCLIDLLFACMGREQFVTGCAMSRVGDGEIDQHFDFFLFPCQTASTGGPMKGLGGSCRVFQVLHYHTNLRWYQKAFRLAR